MEEVNPPELATIPTTEIYKIYQHDENEIIKRVIVFHGKSEEVLSLNEVFSDLEIAEIEMHKTQVIFSKMQIHKDDTIETIKIKLVIELGANTISYNEIYLYSKIKCSLYLEKFYKEVTQNEQVPFTPNMLGQLFMNLQWDKNAIDKMPLKENYSYEDIIKYIGAGDDTDGDSDKEVLIPLGLRFSSTRNLLFSADPFEVLPEISTFQQNEENPLLTFMNTTLLNYGELLENKLYLCLLTDVVDYAYRNKIDEGYMLDLYYPELKVENITSNQDFIENRQSLIDKNKKRINVDLITLYKTVDLFYDVSRSKSQELSYTDRGVVYFEMIFHAITKVNLPIEAIFKNMHATKQMPYIKYNPGSRRENIYRLYYEKSSKSGKKIPVLSKSQINNLSKKSGKRQQLSFYIIGGISSSSRTDIFVDIDNNGNITLRCVDDELNKAISVEEITAIFDTQVRPLIENMNAFLQQTGYKINIYSTLTNEMVEIVHMKYKCDVDIEKPIDLKKYMGCLTSIFDVTENNIRKGASMRFKRVENYRKMNAMSTMITEIYKRTDDQDEVVNALMSNYNMRVDEAVIEIAKFMNDHIRIDGKFVNKSVDLAENPGFLTTMKVGIENKLTINIENINAISYVEILDMYIDSFLQITQIPDTLTDISVASINELCVRKEYKTTVAPIETVILPVIQKAKIQPLQFTKKFDDEYEEEEEYQDEAAGEGEDEDEDDEDKIFFEDEDEDEDEENEDQDQDIDLDEEKEEGGEPNTRSQKIGGVSSPDVEQLSSKYFLNKRKQLEPNLFLTSKEGNYKVYTRACPLQRQPVILTEEEKQKIDKENRGAYSYAVRYGTNPDKKYWYVCPRFWCMKTNQPLNEQQVKNGECQGAVHEFTSNDHIKDRKYINHYPGFLPKDTHPTSCVPCCMKKNWDTNVQQKIRRNECNINEAEDITVPPEVAAAAATTAAAITTTTTTKKRAATTAAQPPEATTATMATTAADKAETSMFYIVGFDKYPIPRSRWGFLPPSIQSFLQINYNDVIIKKTPAFIKSGATTYLRYGVEQSRHQSFLGCIADIYASVNRYKELGRQVPTIAEFRKILQQSVSLDFYIKSHNGSLVSIFQPAKMAIGQDIIDKYADTEFYKKIDQRNENQFDFLEDTIASFENFQQFLTDKDALIDHTYLWDMISSKNAKLFPNGLNLVIMEVADKDITDNVEVLCPTNSYMDKFYDNTRETVILLKHNEFYEPIYMYNLKTLNNREGSTPAITTRETFSEQVAPAELKRFLVKIQNSNNKYCRGMPSMPNVYTFKQNKIAINILRILKTFKYNISSQVVNYRDKVIGFMVSQTKDDPVTIYIPTFPSSQIADVPIIHMDDVKWQSYEKTRDFLISIAKKTKGDVLCQPSLKVVENSLIIGIFTETNQYIQIDPPIADDIEDDIRVFHSKSFANKGYYMADKTLAISDTEDPERTKLTKRVYLETQFYTAFRTTIRIILNEFGNREIRDKIIELIENDDYLYAVKMKKIELLLRYITQSYVVFNDIPDNLLGEFGEITTCTSNCKTKKYCLVKEDASGGEAAGENCVMILPSKNLITAEDNNQIYYGRISDELLRYKRIQLFLLKPKKYLNVSNIEYKIDANEFLLLQSLIDGNYFDNLVPFQSNKYVKNVPYDLATPNITQTYSNDVSVKDQVNSEEFADTNKDTEIIIECIEETLDEVIGNNQSYWKQIFPVDTQEIVLNQTKDCTFYLMIDIIYKHLKFSSSIMNIKTALVRKYRELPKYHSKIMAILSRQGGKKKMVDKVIKSHITIENLIMSEDYFLTNLDLWALSSLFNLPVLLFSSKNLENMSLNVKWIALGGDRMRDTYFFVRASVEKGVVPQYHLLKPPRKLSELRNNFSSMINNVEYIDNNMDLETYLERVIVA